MNMSSKNLSERTVLALSILLSLIMFTNGAIMLMNPIIWYTNVPGVIMTGAFNQHFIRDIGLLYLLIGAALATGAIRRENRLLLWGTIALWLSAHAAFHVWEVLVGLCGPSALTDSFAGVVIPAVISLGLTVWTWLNPPPQKEPKQ